MISLSSYLPQLRSKKINEENYLFCQVRKKWLHATPEELVRQTCICYLTDRGYSLSHITVERQILVNRLPRRYDIVVSEKAGSPIILVECKAATEALGQKVMDQAGAYNLGLEGQYIWITNGHENRIFEIDHQMRQYHEIHYIPLRQIG